MNDTNNLSNVNIPDQQCHNQKIMCDIVKIMMIIKLIRSYVITIKLCERVIQFSYVILLTQHNIFTQVEMRKHEFSPITQHDQQSHTINQTIITAGYEITVQHLGPVPRRSLTPLGPKYSYR